MDNSNTISIVAEINADLHQAMLDYLDEHPYWDLTEVFNASLSLFMLQNWHSDRKMKAHNHRTCRQVYLDSVLQESFLDRKYSSSDWHYN